MTTPYVAGLVSIAEAERAAYGGHNEHDSVLAKRIRTYWEELGFAFPGVTTAWSAVFVSWCVKRAGATRDEFAFSARHAAFVNKAINDADDPDAVFKGVPITQKPPALGDIIQWNRGGGTFDFAHAAAHSSYPSHSAIVVATGTDQRGRFALTVGGNESDTVGRTRVPLDAAGMIVQRVANPFIAHVVTLK